MSSEIIGLIGIGITLLLIFSRMPVGFVLALVGFLGIIYLLDVEAAFYILSSNFWEQFASYNFAVVPLFIFMGMIISRSAIGATLFDTAYKWMGQLPGGLAIATTAASAGFGAMCGSGNAAVATMGTVSLPEMR
jgi:TRAP-type mannitol/chloroaromatic compound transport system permease large subunit